MADGKSEENGLTRETISSATPTLPPYPQSSQADSEEENGSVATDEEGEVFSENDDGFAAPPMPVPVNSENPDGISDHSVAQIELFFSSRFVRVGVCQCHATLFDPSMEKPTKGVMLLQSFLDRQLPTQVYAARLVLCTSRTFHIIWTRPVYVSGPEALKDIKDDDERLVLGPNTRVEFTGTKPRREAFIQVVKGALQRMRIHVSQDKSARKKAIKEYRKSQKIKSKVKKNHISIPCEFAHVTRFTHKAVNYETNGAEVS